MTGKVLFLVSMSLDGFIAPEERMDDRALRWPELDEDIGVEPLLATAR
jgi:hypothetical protein